MRIRTGIHTGIRTGICTRVDTIFSYRAEIRMAIRFAANCTGIRMGNRIRVAATYRVVHCPRQLCEPQGKREKDRGEREIKRD
jgi:hypothetical protein